jgi:hypothetical protein
MNFFDFSSENQRWIISDKLWLYWVITIPLTAATILIWALAFPIDNAMKRVLLRLKEIQGFKGRITKQR